MAKRYNFRKGSDFGREVTRYGVTMTFSTVVTIFNIPAKYLGLVMALAWKDKSIVCKSCTMELRHRPGTDRNFYIVFRKPINYSGVMDSLSEDSTLAMIEVLTEREARINNAAFEVCQIRDRFADSIRALFYSKRVKASLKPDPREAVKAAWANIS